MIFLKCLTTCKFLSFIQSQHYHTDHRVTPEKIKSTQGNKRSEQTAGGYHQQEKSYEIQTYHLLTFGNS